MGEVSDSTYRFWVKQIERELREIARKKRELAEAEARVERAIELSRSVRRLAMVV